MLKRKRLLNSCWAEAVVQNKIPIRAWSGRKHLVKHLRFLGCIFYDHKTENKRSKLFDKTEKGICRICTQSKGYQTCSIKTKKLRINNDVAFDENAT